MYGISAEFKRVLNNQTCTVLVFTVRKTFELLRNFFLFYKTYVYVDVDCIPILFPFPSLSRFRDFELNAIEHANRKTC